VSPARLLAKARALVTGYFWLPCPICGEPFAGFEAGDVCLWDGTGRGIMVCRACDSEALLRNMIAFGEARRTRPELSPQEWESGQ
jgi:hypothetical protein